MVQKYKETDRYKYIEISTDKQREKVAEIPKDIETDIYNDIEIKSDRQTDKKR